jgi:ketosteroid isomerase-like protein
MQTLGRANTDGLMALLTEPLYVFGPRRTDTMTTRTDALVALRATFDAMGKDAKPSLKTGELAVVASPGGNSAWAVDVVDVEGKPMSAVMVLSNDDDFWVVVAAAVAHTPSMREVRAELKKDAIVPPGMPGIAKVDDSAEGAVERFKNGLADPTAWAEDLGKRSDAIVIGPSEGDVTRGKKEIAKLWKKRAKVNVRHASAGELTAATTRDGQLAWVTAPVVRFADDDDPLPLRLFCVFEKSEGKWQMIALQESLALDEPGVGANFKKVKAPGVKEEEPPPKPKEEEKKPAPKKKKKKKK